VCGGDRLVWEHSGPLVGGYQGRRQGERELERTLNSAETMCRRHVRKPQGLGFRRDLRALGRPREPWREQLVGRQPGYPWGGREDEGETRVPRTRESGFSGRGFPGGTQARGILGEPGPRSLRKALPWGGGPPFSRGGPGTAPRGKPPAPQGPGGHPGPTLPLGPNPCSGWLSNP